MRGNTITLHMVYGRIAQAGNLWRTMPWDVEVMEPKDDDLDDENEKG